jgi:hypothetical protein
MLRITLEIVGGLLLFYAGFLACAMFGAASSPGGEDDDGSESGV